MPLGAHTAPRSVRIGQDEVVLEGRGAYLSPCRLYRYILWSVWDVTKPLLHFIMLNPSTADEVDSDATILRCIERAKRLGYGGVVVTNLFAWRETKPKELFRINRLSLIGSLNDQAIWEVYRVASATICAWGKDGGFLGRASSVLALLHTGCGCKHTFIDCKAKPLYVLELTKNGSPVHPLYQSYDLHPREWSSRRNGSDYIYLRSPNAR
jgi:hypothetical protein